MITTFSAERNETGIADTITSFKRIKNRGVVVETLIFFICLQNAILVIIMMFGYTVY